jgi:hypothetical protein
MRIEHGPGGETKGATMVVRERPILVTLPLIGIAAVVIMLNNLNCYENADACATPTIKSRNCIAHAPAIIADIWTDASYVCSYSGGGCPEVYDHRVAVVTEGGRATLTLADGRPDLEVSDKVQVIIWDGHEIGLDAHGLTSYVKGWHPSLVKIGLPTIIILLLATSILLAIPGQVPRKWMKSKPGVIFLALLGFMVFFVILVGLDMSLLF